MIYGEKFTRTVRDEESKKDWKEVWALGLADMTGQQIAISLEKCLLSHAWPPSIAEFRELSITKEVIDYRQMFIDAANAISTQVWKDRLVYSAAWKFGIYELRNSNMNPKDISRWQDIIDELKTTGKLLDLPQLEVKRIEQKPDMKIVERELNNIKNIEGKDFRAWAKAPKSARAVELMFSDPPMPEEIEIARKAGYIDDRNQFIPEHKRQPRP